MPVAPLGEAIPNIELFRRLAGRMGFEDECFCSAMRKWPGGSGPVCTSLQGVDMDLLSGKGMPS